MPTIASVHIDTFLTNIMAGSINAGFVAREVLPVVPSSKETGKVAQLGRDHYRIDFPARAPGSKSPRIEWAPTSTTFDAEEYSLEYPIDNRTAAQYDDPYDAFRDATLVLRQKLDLKLEDLVATLFTTAANYDAANTVAGTQSWDTTGTPVTDVMTAITQIIDVTGAGMASFEGVCSHAVFNILKTNTEVKESFINTVPGQASATSMSAQAVATALGLQMLHVGTAVKNTAAEGATESMSAVWGADNFVVFSRAPNPGILSPNFGMIVAPNIPGFPGIDTAVDQYRDESVRSDVVRATFLAAEIIAESKFGFFYQDVIA